MNNELYGQIFKRKSFHLFGDVGDEKLSPAFLDEIREAWSGFTPLFPEIKTEIRIVPESETTCRVGAEYCVLIYSENKDGYLQNAGYIGEQLDLWLVARGVGTLWCGIGKPRDKSAGGLDYVIMLAVRKVGDPAKFRDDPIKIKRKPADEIWEGAPVIGVTDVVRLAPSACNSQPWLVKNGGEISVYRNKKAARVGLLPSSAMLYFNRIDMGIFLCFFDLCLGREGIAFEREACKDVGDGDLTKNAVYRLG